MEQLLQEDQIRTAIIGFAVLALGGLGLIVTALIKRAVQAIEQWGAAQKETQGLASEERRRRIADEVVQAVQQMGPDKPGGIKLSDALELAKTLGYTLVRAEIEAAVRRLKTESGWLDETRADLGLEGTD